MKQSRLAAAALSMAILLSGCSTGYASMEASAGSTERIRERNSGRPDQQEGNSGKQGSGRELPAGQ